MKARIRDLIIFTVLVFLDQLSKYWVKTDLINRDVVLIPKVLKLQYHTNTGAVWGILTDKTLFLSIFTILILLLIIIFYFKIPRQKKYLALNIIIVLIAAGAVGNLIDRIFLGYVIDFIYFELINFPLFNFADSYLVVSCIALFILTVFYYKDEDLLFIYGLFGKGKASVPEGKKIETKSISDNEKNTDNISDKGLNDAELNDIKLNDTKINVELSNEEDTDEIIYDKYKDDID